MNQWVSAAGSSSVRACAAVLAALWLCTACAMPGGVLPVVKIGLAAPFEGPQRAMAYDVLFATKLAIAEFNAEQRSQSGRLVELVALNDDGQVASAGQVAREMAVDPAIVGVVGPWSADSAAAMAAVYREADLPVVCLAPGAEGVAAVLHRGYRDAGFSTVCDAPDPDDVTPAPGPALLSLSASNAEIGAAAAEHVAKQEETPRVVVVRAVEIAARSQADAFVATLDGLGVPVAGVVSLDVSSPVLVDEVARLDPDVVFLAGEADEVIAALSNLRGAGVDAEWLTGPELDRFDLVQIAGPVASGVSVVAVAPSWRDLGEDDGFVTAFRGMAGKPPGSQAIAAYDAARLLLRAVALAAGDGPVTRAAVSAQLAAQPEMAGLTGELRFDPSGNRLDAPLWIRVLEN